MSALPFGVRNWDYRVLTRARSRKSTLCDPELRGITDEKIATIIAGQRPGDLTREEAVAYDLASALVSGGVLPALVYQQAIALFGQEGTAEFIYMVGLYCMVSVTLNGFDPRYCWLRDGMKSISVALPFSVLNSVSRMRVPGRYRRSTARGPSFGAISHRRVQQFRAGQQSMRPNRSEANTANRSSRHDPPGLPSCSRR